MKLNEESLFILILIGQLYTVFMALGYLRNLLSNAVCIIKRDK
ncbi:hypothetical protein [Enterococcus hirae]|nr:hypothetical protein [Enterococcus hirae]